MTLKRLVDRWGTRKPSELGHHAGTCCKTAREWFRAMAASHGVGTPGVSGPLWLSRDRRWGPSSWPVHWCEAVESDELDCGAWTALAREAYGRLGFDVACVQLVFSISNSTADHWHARWRTVGRPADWIRDHYAYHEACGVLEAGRIFIWDGARSSWIERDPIEGRVIVALRVLPDERGRWPETVGWDGAEASIATWMLLDA